MARNAMSGTDESKPWRLGQTSERYESGGRGAGTVSSGRHDHGGASYGTYQLSSKSGTLAEYLQQSRYGRQFDGLTPATPAFDAKWREIARDDPGFAADQHDFIRRSHFDIQARRLAERGVDLTDRGPAVQDALWSTSVQFRNRTRTIFEAGLAEKFGADYQLARLSDSDIVEAVQAYKIHHNASLFASSPRLWPGLLARAEAEKAALLQLEHRQHDLPPLTPLPVNPGPANMARGHRGEEVRAVQNLLDALGYHDAHGHRLHPDGDFGRRTEEAVKAFQHAHGLEAVGYIGPKTHAALEAARRSGPTPVDPAHPDHALQQQVSRAVDAMEHALGRTPDAGSQRLKASLLVAAREHGLTQVDRVVLSEARGGVRAGQNVFAVQGRLDDPASRRVHVATQHALATPVDASYARLATQEATVRMQPSPATAHAMAATHGEYGAGLRRSPSP